MLKSVTTFMRAVTVWLNAAGTALILLIMFMVNLDVFSLNLRNAPIAGVKESVALSIAVIVFLQLPETLRARRHIVSDAWLNTMLRRVPRVGQSLQALYHLLGASIMGLIAYYGYPLATRAYDRGDFVGTQGVFTLPEWPTFAIVVFCAVVAAVQYLLMSLQFALNAFDKASPVETV